MKKESNFENLSSSSLFRALSLLRFTVLVTMSVIMGMIIYTSFEKSIQRAFDPVPVLEMQNRKSDTPIKIDPNRVENGIHVETGMVYDDNFALVRRSCTSCHSSKLVIQNRATRDGWKQMIDWMKETQGLQDLGKFEVKILDYLEKNYAPTEKGRRVNLDIAESDWYVIDLD